MAKLCLVAAGSGAIAILIPGCSAFHGSRALDMSPFAENTSLMFAEAAKVSRPFRYVYLKPYIDIREIEELRRQGQPVIDGLEALVLYSNQVVALSMASKSNRERNRLLADYLERATSKVATRQRLEELGISAATLDSTLIATRGAETFIDGIAAASSLVNVIVLALLDGLEALNASLPTVIAAIDSGIESNFRQKRTAYERLTRLQARDMIALAWLYEGKAGDTAAVDSLLQTDPSMRTRLPAPERATPQQFDAAETELISRLERLNALIENLSRERSYYLATQQELADLRVNLDQRIKVARDAVVVWGQSHRNLGIGVPVPPLVNLSAIASGVTKSVPLP